MPTPHADSLAAQLALRNRQLDLMLELDRLRDAIDDEVALFTQAIALLGKAIPADLILAASLDADTRQLDVRALLDRASLLDRIETQALRAMLDRASELAAPQQLIINHNTWHVLAAPLRPQHESLGALLMINATQPFAPDDLALLTVAAAQLDSALQQMHLVAELRQERQELRTLYKIDRIRDRGLPFNTMLAEVLIELCRAIPSEAGFIMLFDTNGQQLELRAATNDDLLTAGDHYQHVYAAAQEAVQRGSPIVRGPISAAIRSVMCLPLILNTHVIGVLGVLNRRDHVEFTRADRHTLWAIASQIDTAIFEGLQIQKYREVFGRRVGPKVMERLLNTPERDLLKGERTIVSILFSDLRGFTNTAEIVEPELLVRMLNDHLSTMTEIVLKHEGLVDKFVGDCVMALFNVPERQPDHASRIIATALDMMAAHQTLMSKWQPHLPPIGIGIDTGETIVGNLGSTQRNEYTAISHHVNLASRLCGAAEANQILIGPDTYALVRDHVVAIPIRGLKLKGIGDAVDAFQILELR
jgi:adenylate cyclase